jgi:putative transposase
MLLTGLIHCLGRTTVHRLGRVVAALLSMTGRVTMLGLSRWSEEGGSDRTIQRLFNTTIAWGHVQWLIIRQHLLEPGDVLLLAGDEVVVTKAGKKTYGLDRLFSSLYGKAVPGLCFLSLSLISVGRRASYPVLMEPVLTEAVVDSPTAAKPTPAGQRQRSKKNLSRPSERPKQRPAGQRGRPKGSRNRNRQEGKLSPDLRFVQGMIPRVLTLVGRELGGRYCLFDGALGHAEALRMIRQTGLQLISKLRHDSALDFPYDGPYAGRGPRRQYGDKLHYQRIPARYLKASTVEKGIRTDIYPMAMRHTLFADRSTGVIRVKTKRDTGARAHVVLFSSDPGLAYEQMIDYYRLRFQREFNFRDAKHYWGLEDFMVVNPTPVYNSANLAMLMVNLSQVLIHPFRKGCPDFSVNDLKAWFRGWKYALETLKCLPEILESISIEQIIAHVTSLGQINHAESVA